MTKRMIFGVLALVLALGVWLLWPEQPGLPEGAWIELAGEPAVWDDAAGSLEQASHLRSFSVTEGELRGGKPAGATLTVRWGARWTVPGEELEIAWEAAWSEMPRSGNRQIGVSWQGADPMSQPLDFARRSYSAAARADGTCGCIRLVPTYPARTMESALLTLTVSQGEGSAADRMMVK